VEVQLDGGKWRTAIPDAKPQSKYCWKFYSLELGKVTPGKHTIVSRAIDVNGRIQPSADDDEIALKKTFGRPTSSGRARLRLRRNYVTGPVRVMG